MKHLSLLDCLEMFSQAALLVVLAVAVQGEVIGMGPCPAIDVVQDFDVARYLGTWFEIRRYPNRIQAGNCSTANYGPVNDDGRVQVHNTEMRDGAVSDAVGTAELADPNSTEAKLIVRFNIPGVNATHADYWVLGTDYDNYSLVWSCRTFGTLVNMQSSWVLSRTKPISDASEQAVIELMRNLNLSPEAYVTFDQDDCQTAP